jgi:uncharacterized protein
MNEAPPVRQSHTWEVLCHVAALAGYIGVPFGNIIGPLVIWAIKRAEIPAVDAHGKEAMNFQISMTIYAIISGILVFVVIGIFLLVILGLAGLILTIIGAVKASNGELYRYPLTMRLIK